MKFQVFDSGKPADSKGHPKTVMFGLGLDNSVFESFEEAVKYARAWLGCFDPESEYKWEVNKVYYYYEDFYMVIKPYLTGH